VNFYKKKIIEKQLISKITSRGDSVHFYFVVCVIFSTDLISGISTKPVLESGKNQRCLSNICHHPFAFLGHRKETIDG
jgi:hypothetical protein